jgi:hypothetical protein
MRLSKNHKMKSEVNKVIYIDELPDGNFRTEAGAVLSPDQFEKLQRLEENILWIIFVDFDLQRKRNDKPLSLTSKNAN